MDVGDSLEFDPQARHGHNSSEMSAWKIGAIILRAANDDMRVHLVWRCV
jgi:hypothetical protein